MKSTYSKLACLRLSCKCSLGASSFIIIKDNGGGISAEVLEHLFYPFFTSKHEGIARGLGLSYSLNAFVINGENLEIVDDPEGVTFKVILPRM